VVLPRKVYKSSSKFAHSFQLSDEIVVSFTEVGEYYDMKINSISFRNLQVNEKIEKETISKALEAEKVPGIVLIAPEEKENVPCNSQKNEKIEKTETSPAEKISEVVKSDINLIAMDERPQSVFPLKEEEELSLNLPLNLRKMQSAEIPKSSQNSLNDLFDQLTFTTDKKEPCKAELVTNLYTRTFSADNTQVSEDSMKKKRK